MMFSCMWSLVISFQQYSAQMFNSSIHFLLYLCFLAFKKEFQKLGGAFTSLAKSFEFDDRTGEMVVLVDGFSLPAYIG